MSYRTPEEIAADSQKEQVCCRMNARDKKFLEKEAAKAGTTLSRLVGKVLEHYASDLREHLGNSGPKSRKSAK